MRHTSIDQTAGLLELGFPEPENDFPIENAGPYTWCQEAYTVDELLSFLPEKIGQDDKLPSTLNICVIDGQWIVEYADFLGSDFTAKSKSLIDALYDMILTLKEKSYL